MRSARPGSAGEEVQPEPGPTCHDPDAAGLGPHDPATYGPERWDLRAGAIAADLKPEPDQGEEEVTGDREVAAAHFAPFIAAPGTSPGRATRRARGTGPGGW